MKISWGRGNPGRAQEGTQCGISKCLLVASWTASLTDSDMTAFLSIAGQGRSPSLMSGVFCWAATR